MTTEQLNALFGSQAQQPDQLINSLKAAKTEMDLTPIKKQFDVSGHAVMDRSLRLDKLVSVPDETDPNKTNIRTEPVNRIGISLQELICERAVSFLFGSPVKIQCEPEGEQQALILQAINQILKDNKIDSFNAEVALELFRSTEVAECWFVSPVTDTYKRYGFDTNKKLKCVLFSPWNGDTLYPLFSDTGDMIAFSREYVLKEEGKQVTYFETYTADYIRRWKKGDSGWQALPEVVNEIKKIPIVYAKQATVEWAPVQNIIERIEKQLSNYADTTDYHASPTLFGKGDIDVFPKKGEQGKLIIGKGDATLEYVSLDQAPEMVKFEYDTLLSLIYAISQTPNISFEAMKGLGDISGVAFDRLFVDAKLKVKKKRRIFDAYLERRTSLILAFMSRIKTDLTEACSVINIDAVVQPFTFEDQKELVDTLTTATAGGILSKKTAIKLSGFVDDVDKEFDQLNEEEKQSMTLSITEPTI